MRRHLLLQKRLFTLMMLTLVLNMASAQDVIFTRTSERIEANVVEVSDETVRYHRADNLNGPVFVIKNDQLDSIVFANGDVKIFKTTSGDIGDTQSSTSKEVVEINLGLRTVRYVPGGQMTYYENSNLHFSYYNVLGSVDLLDDEYGKFVEKVCPEAYSTYKTAKTIRTLCWVSGFVGAICGIYGGLSVDKEDFQYGGTKTNVNLLFIGVGLSGVSLMTLELVPSIFERSVEKFNDNCSNKYLLY